jgi:hypothetical protein
MLAVPFLLGVAASQPSPWQLVLAAAAVAGYLASATAQAWLRARRRASFVPSLTVYAVAFGVLGLALLAVFPALLLVVVVVVPAGAATLAGARPGTRRDLANSLAQVAIAIVLVPAAACVSGDAEAARVLQATLVAGAYLVGTVLVVRSVIRERGSSRFAAASAAYHLGLVVLAAAFLAEPYALVAAVLAVRAIGLPIVQRRRAGTAHPLRPVHVGIVEIVVSTILVAVAFAAPA